MDCDCWHQAIKKKIKSFLMLKVHTLMLHGYQIQKKTLKPNLLKILSIINVKCMKFRT